MKNKKIICLIIICMFSIILMVSKVSATNEDTVNSTTEETTENKTQSNNTEANTNTVGENTNTNTQNSNNVTTENKQNVTSNNTNKNTKATTKKIDFKSVNEKVYVTKNVNLRNQYGTSGSIALTAKKDTELTRTGIGSANVDGNAWSRVIYNGNTYYCISTALTTKAPEDKQEEPEKKEEEPVISKSEEPKEEKSNLTKLEIKGFTLTPEFNPAIRQYNVEVTDEISELDIKTEGLNDNVKIEVAGNKDLADGENTITIMVYNSESKENETYQITVTKKAVEKVEESIGDTINPAKEKANKIKKIAGICIGCFLLGIIGCVVFIKYKKRNSYHIEDEDEEEEYIEKEAPKNSILESKLNLNEEDEFFNRVNQNSKRFKKEIENNNEYEEDEEQAHEFFRTSYNKKKGKHF